MQKNILEYLEATAGRLPDKIAFQTDTEALSFRQVHQQARSIGSRLLKDGYCNQPIPILMGKRPQTIAAFFGVIYAGCAYVPLDVEMPRHRLEQILSQLPEGPILCDAAAKDLAAALNRPALFYEEAAFGPVDAAALAALRERQIDLDPIYIVFTSGSTGVPKGVMGCHRAVMDYIENLCTVLQFNEHTVFGNQTPLYFDACLKEIIPTIKYGATTVLIPKSKFLFPVKLIEFLNDYRVNTLCWVVSALTMISSLGALDTVVPQYVRTIAFASEVFPIRQLNRWRKALPHTRFLNLYGPTETTGICCYYELDRAFSEDETLPIGRPFPNTQILLLDEENRVPEPGQQGEICIRGTRLTLGYYRDEQRTEAAFVQNPLHNLYPDKIYRTGDLGRYNARGELEFISRKDHQIKHMGHRIELGEVEAAACSHQDVTSACCLYTSGKLFLYYTGPAAATELSSFLRSRLPRYMLPGILRQLDTLPRTPNGKPDRKTLLERSSQHG
mgnify:CR=1 FL=1